MMAMWDRYRDDPLFRTLVDTLCNQIEAGNMTPTEVRQAAMLAQIMYEDRNPRPIIFTREEVINRKV